MTLAAIYLRRVGIESRSYVATPMQVSAVVTPPAPMEKKLGVKKAGGGAETLSHQVISNSAAIQEGTIKYAAL